MTTVRLSDLTPATVGREAADLVLARLSRLVLPLSPGVTLRWDQQGDSDLALTVAALTEWAQTGAAWDWADHEDAADALQTAAEALYASPARGWDVGDLEAALEIERGEEVSAPVLVLACALTRLRVCRGQAVTLAELARLASISYQRAHQLAGAGELEVVRGTAPTPTTVTADEARRWLAARGLRGW